MAHEGHSYETLKQMVADWQKYAGTQHRDIMRLSACMHALQREIFAMREQERQRLSTAETMRLLTGGVARKPCGCAEGDTSCLHGIPAGLPDGDAPPAVQRPDYLGVAHHPLAVDDHRAWSRVFQLPASLLVPQRDTPPPPATTEPDELRELYNRLVAAVSICRRLLDERDGGR